MPMPLTCAVACLAAPLLAPIQESGETPASKALRTHPTRLEASTTLQAGQARSGFGFALAAVGDWDQDGVTDVAASAPEIGEQRRGRVRVLSGADARVLAEFTSEEPEDEFGYALAGGFDVDGDGTHDLAIGVRAATSGGSKRGAVLFVSGRTKKLLEQRIVGTEDHAFTGAALVGLADVDGDGKRELAVASPGESLGRGLVRVYAGGGLRQLYTLRGRSSGDQFGASMASDCDLNGDGRDDLIVGAPNESRRAPESGTARVFEGKTGRLLRTVTTDQRYTRLGARVAGLGDVTGDGRDEFVVASPSSPIGDAPDAGLVIVYDGAKGKPLHRMEGSGPGAFFGRGLVAGEDLNGDGWPDLVIGAPYADRAPKASKRKRRSKVGAARGLAWVYSGATGELLQELTLPDASDLSGSCLALVRSDAQPSMLAIGAPGRPEQDLEKEAGRARPGTVSLFEVTPLEDR